MAIDYAALKTELNTDPIALGYASLVAKGSDHAVADLINAVGVGAAFQVPREPITGSMLFSFVDPAEFAALTAIKLQQLTCVLLASPIDINDPRMQQILLGIMPGATKGLVQGILKRQGSRAEVLFGRGTMVVARDVSFALRGAG